MSHDESPVDTFRLPAELKGTARAETLEKYGRWLLERRDLGLNPEDLKKELRHTNRARCAPPLTGSEIREVIDALIEPDQDHNDW
ncbi:hypothetical protein ES707_08434 [subsurface metagenome]